MIVLDVILIKVDNIIYIKLSIKYNSSKINYRLLYLHQDLHIKIKGLKLIGLCFRIKSCKCTKVSNLNIFL